MFNMFLYIFNFHIIILFMFLSVLLCYFILFTFYFIISMFQICLYVKLYCVSFFLLYLCVYVLFTLRLMWDALSYSIMSFVFPSHIVTMLCSSNYLFLFRYRVHISLHKTKFHVIFKIY